MPLTVYDEKVPGYYGQTITSSKGTAPWVAYTSFQDSASRIDSLVCTTDKTTDTLIDVGIGFVQDLPGAFYKVATLTIPAGAGNGTVPPYDITAHLPAPYQNGIAMTRGGGFTLRLQVALADGESITFLGMGGDL